MSSIKLEIFAAPYEDHVKHTQKKCYEMERFLILMKVMNFE